MLLGKKAVIWVGEVAGYRLHQRRVKRPCFDMSGVYPGDYFMVVINILLKWSISNSRL
jgi:hypothetical protein